MCRLMPKFRSTNNNNQEKSVMQFELERTTAKFGIFNPREEKNKGNAFDLPFSVTLGAEILAMLAPTTDAESNDEDLAQELFTKEGHVSRHSINPIHINRKPEGAVVKIWDQEDFGEPLELKPCTLTTLKAELQTPHHVVLTGKVQYSQYNDNELIRINALMNKSFDLAIHIEQTDLFENPEGESEEEAEGSEE
jgi:hypothetical protein